VQVWVYLGQWGSREEGETFLGNGNVALKEEAGVKMIPKKKRKRLKGIGGGNGHFYQSEVDHVLQEKEGM